jgi:Zn-dependent protease with chaperone function
MSDGAVPYPPAPANVPPDLTTPSVSYRLRVLIVLTSLVLFALLYLGLVAGTAYFCYTSFAAAFGPDLSSRPSRLAVLQDVSRREAAITQGYNHAVLGHQQGRMDDARFLQTMEREVLTPWRSARQRLAQTTGLPKQEQRIVDQYQKALQVQEESWVLLCRAAREQNREAMRQGVQKGNEAEELSRQLAADAERVFNRRSTQSDWGGWNVILGIVSGLLCLFLVKGFFKWRRADREQRLEVTEKDQPILFAFLRRLCQEARAPLPHRVYLAPEVNAAVFYHESILSLVLPTPKNLVIGLGLVNQLNLSEFKAVLAHEFGHFSQSSMKLGNYVYMSNRILAELVFGRDGFDDFVTGLRRSDVRIAVFAWGFTGILWLLRQGMQRLFQAINFANAALSRQMEFNADLVAVRLTGLDALVHGLARLSLATESLGQAWSDLSMAADHGLYSRDQFFHQTQAADYLRHQRQDAQLGIPPKLPDDPQQFVQVFEPQDTSAPRMWATHPSNHDREVNAKHRYLRSPIDERSPWILFQDAPAVREQMTRRLYQAAERPADLKLQDPETVQAFIDEEHAETTYHPRYHGLYDQRYLTPGELDALLKTATAFADAGALGDAYSGLYGAELKARMEAHRAREEDYRKIAPLALGAVELTGKDFLFRGTRYRTGDASHLLEQVKKELEADYDWMADVDRQAFLVHYAIACQLGEEHEFLERYRFHLAVQDMHGRLSVHNQRVHLMLNSLSGRRELSQEEFGEAVRTLLLAYDALCQELKSAKELRLPALKNLTPGAPVAPYLLSVPVLPRLNATSKHLDGDWIRRFLEQLGEVLGKAQRLLSKSLGGLLLLQEQQAERWAARAATPAETVAQDGSA